MKHRKVLFVFLASLLIFLLFLKLYFLVKDPSRPVPLDAFVGVDAAYDDVEGIKRLVDEVRSYTNLFVIGSTGIIRNVTKLDAVCQYVYDSGLYFIVYTHLSMRFPQPQWVGEARERWGDRFFGLYVYDEPGGHQIDNPSHIIEASNFTDAANEYVELVDEYLKTARARAGDLPLFTADYALYWFDYEAGYDVVLAEFGWNHSRLLNVALCRGAASVQGKEWGVMVTWTYNDLPYIESGERLYDDMVLAYQSGAKYIVIFSYPKVSTNPYGILGEEHLEALKKFWRYINRNPRMPHMMSGRVAYVLPEDYGYGFRGPDDKIWGLWEADDLSNKIWDDVNALLERYGVKVDIIYEGGLEYNNASEYCKLVFWNQT